MKDVTPNGSRSARFSSLSSAHTSAVLDENASSAGMISRARVAAAAALILLLLPAVHTFAQQDWPPDDEAGPPPAYQPLPGYTQPYGAPQYPPQYGNQQYTAPAQPYGQAGSYPQQYSEAQPPYSPQQPLTPDQLQQLVAPIALYPDNLVAQILAASTYPAQVAAADAWLRAQGNAPPEQIAAEANAQTSWDPSIKALTAFPQVLAMMDQNLQWTTSLGNAYYNQPQDVLQTIQVMRERAEAAGNLQSTPQETVEDDQGYVNIAPANPQVVYVPSYNPWDVYGEPVAPYPGFSLLGAIGSFIGNALVGYGPGIAMNAFMGMPWGWLGWGLDWLGHAVLFDNDDYCTRSFSVVDWGFPHGGRRFFDGRGGWGGDRFGGGRGGDRYGWGGGGNRNGWGRGGQGNGWGQGGNRYAGGRGGQGYGSGWGGQSGGGRGGYGQANAGGGLNRGNVRGGPAQGWGDARTQEGFNRGFPQRGNINGRPALPGQGFRGGSNGQFGRQQSYLGNGGSAFNGRQQGGFGRSGFSYGTPSQGFRGSANSFRGGSNGGFGRQQPYLGSSGSGFNGRQQGGFGRSGFSYGRPSQSFRGSGFGGGRSSFGNQPQRSGGFHGFGGGNSNGFRAPKSSGFGGGRSSWGGGGGWKAPKMSGGSHFGGGGHSFGGGHFGGGGGHFSGGGGHFGGGHSSGHGGGGHHR